jgi:hypothetical protein
VWEVSDGERSAVHRYPIRRTARRWQRVADVFLYLFVAVEGLRFSWGLTRGDVLVRPLVFLALVAATLVFLRRSERTGSGALFLSLEGVVFGRQQARWDEIERIALKRLLGRWGSRYDAFVLAEPKPISKLLVPSGRYDHIPFGYWYPDWRTSAIRDDIVRWAPHLLTGTDWWNPRSRPGGPP